MSRKALDAPSAPWPRIKASAWPKLALAWVIAKPGVCAIAGARNARQATDNANAADVSLTDEELKEMDRISRPVTDLIDENPVQWKW